MYVNGSGIYKKIDLETIPLDTRRKLDIRKTSRGGGGGTQNN